MTDLSDGATAMTAVIVVPASSVHELENSGTRPAVPSTSSRSRDHRLAAAGLGWAIATMTSAPPTAAAGKAAAA